MGKRASSTRPLLRGAHILNEAGAVPRSPQADGGPNRAQGITQRGALAKAGSPVEPSRGKGEPRKMHPADPRPVARPQEPAEKTRGPVPEASPLWSTTSRPVR